ncbi:MAG: hypothetical protein KDJ35_09010 [Alphaproteobacteria bacterium]|nr:hypothetical protein [Alphaproteobacteria bacterium]
MAENETKSNVNAGAPSEGPAKKASEGFPRAAVWLFEGVLILFVLLTLTVVIGAWRIHSRPLNVDFAKSYVEQSLSDVQANRFVKIGQIQLVWPKFNGPILLGMASARIEDDKGKVFAEIDEAAVGLLKSRLLFGQVAPSLLIVKRPHLRVTRDKDGDVDFGFETESAPQDVPRGQEEILESILSYIADPKHGTGDSSVLSTLTAFKIEEAQLIFEGRRNGIDVELPNLNVTFTNPKHDNQTSLLIISSGGSFRYEGVYSEPLALGDISILAAYDSEQKNLTLSNATITANDVTIRAEASLNHDEQAMGGALKITIDEVRQEQIGPLWPELLENDNSAKWIVQRMSEGTFRNAIANMKLIAAKRGEGWFFDAQDITASWDFEGLKVNYRDPMMPLTQAKGSGIFDNKQEKVDIRVHEGKIGNLQVTDAQLEFVNIIEGGKGKADINLKLDGPLSDIFDYVRREPIHAAKRFDPSQVQGHIKASVNVVFPTTEDMRTEDVRLYIVGHADQISLPGVVGDLTLSGGPFDVKAKNNLLTISGPGMLEGQAVEARYETFLHSEGEPYSSKITAKMLATDAMRAKMGLDLSDFLSGPAEVDVVYTEYKDDRSEAAVTVDLTPTSISLKPFAYTKPEGIEGHASLNALLRGGDLYLIKDLQVSAPNLFMPTSEFAFRTIDGEPSLSGGKIDNFKIHQNAGSLQLEVTPQGQWKMVLNTPLLDARPFIDDEKESEEIYNEPPMIISVTADKMLTGEGEFVTGSKLYIDIDSKGRFNQLEMDARAGTGDIYLRFKPDASGKRTFRLEADDAGAALKAFGVYDKIVGGELDVYGEPVGRVFNRNLAGKAQIINFKVVNAPSLARLLSTLSLSGVTSMLNGEGLGFTKLESDFNWLYRPNGSLLVLKEGRSSGNSLGLTFDGTFDNAQSVVDVSGTIVPLSGVNKAIGSIPIVGDIITGGTGALIAATYTIKGPSKDPEVSVNPLSVLAPGILRRILFEQN